VTVGVVSREGLLMNSTEVETTAAGAADGKGVDGADVGPAAGVPDSADSLDSAQPMAASADPAELHVTMDRPATDGPAMDGPATDGPATDPTPGVVTADATDRQDARGPMESVLPLVDIPLALALDAVEAGRRAVIVARPLAGIALAPLVVTRPLWPRTTLAALAERGRLARLKAGHELAALADQYVPIAVSAVLDRVDLAALANDVVDEVNLPQIIRESSGAMASESVMGVRIQGIQADQRVSRLVDRLLLRHGERDTGMVTADPQPSSSDRGAATEGVATTRTASDVVAPATTLP
jgi:hypothetical protein